jgi:hypothetical protein
LEGGYGFPFAGCNLPDPSATSYSGVLAVDGTLRYGWPGDRSCPPPGEACSSYSGSSGITLTRLQASMEVTPDANSESLEAAPAGHPFTFRARATPDRLGTYPTPFIYDGAGWQFTTDAGVTWDLDCAWNTSEMGVCTTTFWESGRISVKAIVNGVHMSGGPFHVTVVQPTIDLTLSADTVLVGDTVRVTTTTANTENEVMQGYEVNTILPPDPRNGGGEASSVSPGQPALLAQAAAGGVGLAPDVTAEADAEALVGTSAVRSLSAGSGGLPPCGETPTPKLCYIVPTEVGTATVTVTATSNRQPMSASKTLIVTSGLTLRCPHRVIRATKITCRARGRAKVTGWVFQAQAPIFGNQPYKETRPTNQSARTWSGTLVVPGLVMVAGRIHGIDVQAFDSIKVVRRTGPEWARLRMDMPPTPPEPMPATVTDPTDTSKLFGVYPGVKLAIPGEAAHRNYGPTADVNGDHGGGLGALHPNPIPPLSTDWVEDGPNRGLAYYTEGLKAAAPGSIYYAASLAPADSFYELQTSGRVPGTMERYCAAADLDRLRKSVIAHEKGHYLVTRRYGLMKEVQERVESLVDRIALDENGDPFKAPGDTLDSFDKFDAAHFADIYIDPIDKPAAAEVDDTTSNAKYPIRRPDCYFRFP